MHVHMHMRHFLVGRWANGMPQTHTFIGEGSIDRSGDFDQCIHQCSACSWIQFADIVEVCPWYDQYMPGIVLTWIDKGECQVVFINDVSRRPTRYDVAEYAVGVHSEPYTERHDQLLVIDND